MVVLGTSLVVQVVKTSPSSAGDAGSISGQKPKKKHETEAILKQI